MNKLIGIFLFSLSALTYGAEPSIIKEPKPIHYTFTIEENNVVVNTFTGISHQGLSDARLENLDNITQCHNEIPKFHTICANEEIPKQLKLSMNIIPIDNLKYLIHLSANYDIGLFDKNGNMALRHIEQTDNNKPPSGLDFPLVTHYIFGSEKILNINQDTTLYEQKGFSLVDNSNSVNTQKSFTLKIKLNK